VPLHGLPTTDPSLVASGRAVVSRTSDSITLRPISPRGAVVGVLYEYDMPHCGIHSPIDVDGSFWDAIGIDPSSVDFDGQPGTIRLTDASDAIFTSSTGRVLRLVRHSGTKTFLFCF
jgi:hypothetical protein